MTFEAIAAMPALASWGGVRVGEYSLRFPDLVESPNLGNLVSLTLSKCEHGPRCLYAAARSASGFRLASLSLDESRIGDAGLQHLARSPAFAELRRLTLVSLDAIQSPIIELLDSHNLDNLHSLSLGNPRRGSGKATLRGLVGSRGLGSLRQLSLSNFDELLAKRGAQWFAEWPGLARLESLALIGEVGLNDDGLRRIASSPHLTNLRELTLKSWRGTLNYRLLAESRHLDRLRRLRVGPYVSDTVRAALAARFGDRVTFDAS
jgi:hypothetical protein